MSTQLKTIVRAAVHAGRIVKRHFLSESLTVKEKSVPGDLVSSADLESEREILSILRKEFPRASLVGEESGAPVTSAEVFYVDPIDGTLNFVHGLPIFAVSIGYWVDGEPAAAVVHDPMTGVTFTAERGAGAARNGRPLAVSRVAVLRDALIAGGWPYGREGRARLFGEMERIYVAAQEQRALGCASLGMCYVAAGVFDGYWERGLKPWDMAAGVLIIREAGGRVSSLDDGPYDLHSGSIAASNGLVHPALVEALQGT